MLLFLYYIIMSWQIITTILTVLCKSNANEFQWNSWLFMPFRRNFAWNDISTKFPRIFVTPSLLIHANFRMIICFVQWFTANFQVIICSSLIHSSRKLNLLFSNRQKPFLKHSSLTEIYKWPFELLSTKEATNLPK